MILPIMCELIVGVAKTILSVLVHRNTWTCGTLEATMMLISGAQGCFTPTEVWGDVLLSKKMKV